MVEFILKIQCPRCLGTGIDDINGSPGVCAGCGGTGFRPRDVVALPTGIIAAHKILEATDGTEYVLLGADQKSVYHLLISAGKLDLNVGSKSRDLLLGWIFPPGTVSHTAILAAIS